MVPIAGWRTLRTCFSLNVSVLRQRSKNPPSNNSSVLKHSRTVTKNVLFDKSTGTRDNRGRRVNVQQQDFRSNAGTEDRCAGGGSAGRRRLGHGCTGYRYFSYRSARDWSLTNPTT